MRSENIPASDDFHFREAGQGDIPMIAALERASFSAPWPRIAFVQELNNPISSIEILENPNGEMIGYMVYWIVADELHLLDLAVQPTLRRQGIGRFMVRHLEAVAHDKRLIYLTLEVRVGNSGAIGLYHSENYGVVHERKRYYADNNEDALVMAL
jgi:ribosomal-protein-alanine N-acetyltransferase